MPEDRRTTNNIKMWSGGRPTQSSSFQVRKSIRGYTLLLKHSLHLGGVAACNTALALISAWYVVKSLGINVETDAFFASGALPQIVFLVLTATLLPVLVPLLATRDPESF